MAKSKLVQVSVRRMVTDNNFGNYAAEWTERVEVEEGDNIREVRAVLKNRVIRELKLLLEDTVKHVSTKVAKSRD